MASRQAQAAPQAQCGPLSSRCCYPGCAAQEVILYPFFDSSGHMTGCCQALVKVSPNAMYGASVQKQGTGIAVTLHAKWKF
ncbi:MAG: hypothetical protein ACRYG5_02380 [Janthinobacterium lividum]